MPSGARTSHIKGGDPSDMSTNFYVLEVTIAVVVIVVEGGAVRCNKAY